jgi:hypothetical protein
VFLYSVAAAGAEISDKVLPDSHPKTDQVNTTLNFFFGIKEFCWQKLVGNYIGGVDNFICTDLVLFSYISSVNFHPFYT